MYFSKYSAFYIKHYANWINSDKYAIQMSDHGASVPPDPGCLMHDDHDSTSFSPIAFISSSIPQSPPYSSYRHEIRNLIGGK